MENDMNNDNVVNEQVQVEQTEQVEQTQVPEPPVYNIQSHAHPFRPILPHVKGYVETLWKGQHAYRSVKTNQFYLPGELPPDENQVLSETVSMLEDIVCELDSELHSEGGNDNE